jgi:hypothetical protein
MKKALERTISKLRGDVSAHTPGPWESYPHSTEPITTIIGNRTEGIAKVLASGNRELDTANARLIAAAPELLAELKDALAHASEDGYVIGNDKRIRAAIAKAEGGK